MRLTRFDIKYYRSIRSASIIDIDNLLVLIGANNEGKTNILRSVRLALSIMQEIHFYQAGGQRIKIPIRAFRNYSGDIDYIWSRDFPVFLQNHAQLRNKSTEIKLTFLLTAGEVDRFRNAFGLQINGKIPVAITLSREELYIDIVKQGPQAAEFRRQSAEIVKFLSERLKFIYIPPIRSSDIAVQTIQRLLKQKVRERQAPILRDVERRLQAAEREVLRESEHEIRSALSAFIPEITNVSISAGRLFQSPQDRKQYTVFVNDGHSTPLDAKGDGVQSLASLAMLRASATREADDDRGTIFAIEEPEAHLNSEAIYKLRDTIDQNSQSDQVIITTHSPIFTYPAQLRKNIIVRKSKAEPARSMSDIRDALGVRVPENLTTAGVFALVEGETDRSFLHEVLREDPNVQRHIDDGFLRVEAMQGAANLVHQCRHFSQLSCTAFAFLDGDTEGRGAFDVAERAGYISAANVRFTASNVRTQSELEDMFEEDSYTEILERHHLYIDEEFRNHGGKWSVRLRNLAYRTGVALNDEAVEYIKLDMSVHLQGRFCEFLTDSGRHTLDAFRDSLIRAVSR